MSVTLTDKDIERLLREPKPLPANWQKCLELKPRLGVGKQQIDLGSVKQQVGDWLVMSK